MNVTESSFRVPGLWKSKGSQIELSHHGMFRNFDLPSWKALNAILVSGWRSSCPTCLRNAMTDAPFSRQRKPTSSSASNNCCTSAASPGSATCASSAVSRSSTPARPIRRSFANFAPPSTPSSGSYWTKTGDAMATCTLKSLGHGAPAAMSSARLEHPLWARRVVRSNRTSPTTSSTITGASPKLGRGTVELTDGLGNTRTQWQAIERFLWTDLLAPMTCQRAPKF